MTAATTSSDWNTGSSGGFADRIRRISWGAILAGVAVAMVTGLILNLLGLSLGAMAIEPGQGDYGSEALGWGAAIWAILAAIISLLVGGWVAGELSGFRMNLDRALHGLVMFAVVVLLSLYFMTTTIGSLVSGTTNLMGSIISGAGNAAGSAAQVMAMPDPAGAQQQSQGPGFAQQQVTQWMQRNGIQTTSPQAEENITQAAMDYGTALATGGNAEQQRSRLLDTVEQNTTLERAQIEQKVSQFQQQATQQVEQTTQQVKETATKAADTAADATAAGSFGAFLALVLGGAAAAIGAYLAPAGRHSHAHTTTTHTHTGVVTSPTTTVHSTPTTTHTHVADNH